MDDSLAVSEETPVNRVTADEVQARLDRGEPIAFVDSRSAASWADSDVQIKGSVRVPPDHAGPELSKVPKDRSVVTYCT